MSAWQPATAAVETIRGPYAPMNPGPARHEVRFYGVPDGTVAAACEPCGWRTRLEGGHTDEELSRLARMHKGIEDP